MFLGVLGFFTALIFLSTAIAEIRGEPALARAVVLAVMVGLILVVVRIRRSLPLPEERTTGGGTSSRA